MNEIRNLKEKILHKTSYIIYENLICGEITNSIIHYNKRYKYDNGGNPPLNLDDFASAK